MKHDCFDHPVFPRRRILLLLSLLYHVIMKQKDSRIEELKLATEKCLGELRTIRQQKYQAVSKLIKKTDDKKLISIRSQIKEGSEHAGS